VFYEAFPDWAKTYPNFPEARALNLLCQKLSNAAKCIGQRYAITPEALSCKIDQLYKIISQQQNPLDLRSQIENLFPTVEFSPRLRQQFMEFLKLHLSNDARFIQISDHLWYLKSLLDFDMDSFDTLFKSQPLPLATEALIQHKLFSGSSTIPRLQIAFCNYIRAQLRKNPTLIEIGENHWLHRNSAKNLCEQAIQNLVTSGESLTTREVVLAIIPPSFHLTSSALNGLSELIEETLQEHPEVIQITKGYWWHTKALEALLNKAWELLQGEETAQSTEWLLQQCLGVKLKELPHFQAQALKKRFDAALQSDTRFLFEPSTNGWLAVPPGPSNNNVAYQILWESKRPLTFNELIDAIRSRYGLITLNLNLEDDTRFQQLSDGRWALSQWIWINDWAFEYLRSVGIPLRKNTIVEKVCQQRNLDPYVAIFTPEDDPRFVPALYGKWTCRRLLTDEEIEQMLALLIEMGDQGLPLEPLVQRVVGESPEVTDAAERLAADERFINIDDRWFAREAAFYHLSDEDVEKLYRRLTSEKPEHLPLFIADLVQQVLGKDWRLTDAEKRLRVGERFQEDPPGFWAPKGFKPPPVERKPLISPAVRPLKEFEVKQPSQVSKGRRLTPRSSRQYRKRSTLELRRQITITLGFLDVRHGNLRVSPQLRALLPEGEKGIPLIDEKNRRFVAYLDDTKSLLDLRGWISERRLTYGDKVVIQVTDDPNVLLIYPKGERDERVYQEALQRQDVEKLIEQARRTNKSYHDLMIEVMEFIGEPLHREDIYQLVNYRRTASRAYIFSLLSLPGCPYEELRYFVPIGNGYWAFDRQRKEAYDMKIRELEEEIATLKQENARLQERLRKQREHLKDTERKRSSAVAETAQLLQQLEAQKASEKALRGRIHQLEQDNQRLQSIIGQQSEHIKALEQELKKTRMELKEIRQAAEREAEKRETLETEKQSLQTQLAELKEQNERLLTINHEREELVGELTATNKTLQSELNRLHKQKNQLQREREQLEQRVVNVEAEKNALSLELEQIREQVRKVSALEQALATAQVEIKGLQEEIIYLRSRFERVRKVMNTPLGRVFVFLLRLRGGEDLSNLELRGDENEH